MKFLPEALPGDIQLSMKVHPNRGTLPEHGP